MSYVIVTDSCANLTEAMYDQLNITVVPLSFRVKDRELMSYVKGQVTDLKQFYDMMREKETITTSLVSPDTFLSYFSEILKEGKDILYIGFSSGLSGTYQSATIAAEELKNEFPDRCIKTIDSLAACVGQGLLVYYAAKMQQEGKSLEEVSSWVADNVLKTCHWFTVDDLFFLKRGGRVSASTAVLGSLLQVKPVMHVDDEGHLTVVSKARGRKQAIQSLVKEMEKTVVDPQKQLICIAHGDCPEDAEYLKSLVEKTFGVQDIIVSYIDPVIGAHSGPGTLALFFLGTARK